jgi:hypothetical protein
MIVAPPLKLGACHVIVICGEESALTRVGVFSVPGNYAAKNCPDEDKLLSPTMFTAETSNE